MPASTVNLAIPLVRNLRQCADYALVVRPYLHQLRPLPYVVWDHISDLHALKQLYLDTNPFMTGLAVSFFLAPGFLLAAELNQNFSQVDRFWSILPTLYHIHWALWTHLSGYKTELVDLRLTLSVIWSMRLTFNYWRRGGYRRGSEDYRWRVVKNYLGQPWFFLVDVFFTATIQNLVLFLVTSSSYVSVILSRLRTLQGEPAVQPLDFLFSAIILGEIAVTWLADQQQWEYQSAKARYQKTAKLTPGYSQNDLDLGFCTKGLWAYSRHPNFTAEQSVWWTFYLWSRVQTSSPFNWTAVGPVLYSLVFQASTPLTEYLTGKKYPEYKQYQQDVGYFVPHWPLTPCDIKASGKTKTPRKAITATNESPSAAVKNEEDYQRAKKRYDLR